MSSELIQRLSVGLLLFACSPVFAAGEAQRKEIALDGGIGIGLALEGTDDKLGIQVSQCKWSLQIPASASERMLHAIKCESHWARSRGVEVFKCDDSQHAEIGRLLAESVAAAVNARACKAWSAQVVSTASSEQLLLPIEVDDACLWLILTFQESISGGTLWSEECEKSEIDTSSLGTGMFTGGDVGNTHFYFQIAQKGGGLAASTYETSELQGSYVDNWLSAVLIALKQELVPINGETSGLWAAGDSKLAWLQKWSASGAIMLRRALGMNVLPQSAGAAQAWMLRAAIANPVAIPAILRAECVENQSRLQSCSTRAANP